MAKRVQVKKINKPGKVPLKAERASSAQHRLKVKPRTRVEPSASGSSSGTTTWTFLSNHSHVLLLLARNSEMLLREVARLVGITERAVQRIVADLEESHYLERERVGRRNRYKVHPNLPLRHPVEAHCEVGALLELIIDNGKD